jgi:hypothetical protein
MFTSFTPAISPRSAKKIRQQARRWRLHLRTSQSLEDIASTVNPVIRGWGNYYGAYQLLRGPWGEIPRGYSPLVALFLISRRLRLRMGTERNIVARQRRVARGGSGAVAPCSTGAAAKPELRTRSVTDRHRRSGRTKCARRVSAGGANRSHRLRRTVRLSLSLSGEARECSFYLGDWLRVKDVSDANHRTSLRPMSVARNWTASII